MSFKEPSTDLPPNLLAFSMNGVKHLIAPIPDRLQADRELGEYWERAFCKLTGEYGFLFTPNQIGRDQSAQAYMRNEGKWVKLTLPDVAIWSHPGEHHEIKHKAPTRFNSFGLERYRLNALTKFADETKQAVYFTIHRHDLAGGRLVQESRIEHWITQNVYQLAWLDMSGQTYNKNGDSYVAGKRKQVEIIYWSADHFEPLELHFARRVEERNLWKQTG